MTFSDELYAAARPLWDAQLEAEPIWPTTRAYTDFLLRTAADGDMADLDRLAEGAAAAKRERLTGLFLLSSRYEWLFWEMCWKGEQWPETGLIPSEKVSAQSSR